MPIYPYRCKNCRHAFEVFQSIHKYRTLHKCPNCKYDALERIFVIGDAFVKLADTEIKKVGHLAQRNTEKMSDDQRQELHRKHNEYKYKEPEKDLPPGMTRVPRPKEGIQWT